MTTKQMHNRDNIDRLPRNVDGIKEVVVHGVVAIYKEAGETPLQCLDRLRKEHSEYATAVLSYAGRLDPLASGILLVLVGDENKQREKHLHLDKEYEVDVLLGVSTDTYDILGLIDISNINQLTDMVIVPDRLEEAIKKLSHLAELPYPPYSSKTVRGKPLFAWAREGKLNEIKIPNQKGKVKSIHMIGTRSVDRKELLEYVHNQIERVAGDFRQKDILERWDNFLGHTSDVAGNVHFNVIKIHVTCESGVYMRSLSRELGNLLKVPALALSISRTRVGGYNIDSIL